MTRLLNIAALIFAVAWILLWADALHGAVFTVNCGSPTDAGFSGSSYAWTSANQPALASQSVPLNAMRASNGAPFTYTFSDLPFGPYWITLMLIEPNKTAAGQRTFSVSVNDSVILPSVDIFKLANGLLKPLEIILPHAYIGPLTITFTPIVGNAVVSGIKVEAVP